MVNTKLFVSVLLIISSLILIYKNWIFKVTQNLLAYRKFFLILIGCIHGATNLGGAFLSIFSTLVNNESRLQTRNYIANGYFVMGSVQFITILFLGTVEINFSKLY